MTSQSLLESLNPKGHLEIIKRYKDGTEETVLYDHNIITVGMGITLASMFSTTETSAAATDFSIAYFQIGEASALMASSLTRLGNPLESAQYGDSSLTVSSIRLGGAGATPQDVAYLNSTYISKVGDDSSTKVTYTLNLEESACNGIDINECGLWSKNPLREDEPAAYLCAYRSFTAIGKTDSFALIFKWTLEF